MPTDLSPDSAVLCDSQRTDGLKLKGFRLGSAATFSSDTVGLENLLSTNPIYGSPEECSNKPVTKVSDTYRLGTLLYEMIAGRAPFKGRNSLETASAILYKEPSMEEIGNAKLAILLTKALQKDPAARFQSMSEFRDALAAVSV